jgi:hypothetical protein
MYRTFAVAELMIQQDHSHLLGATLDIILLVVVIEQSVSFKTAQENFTAYDLDILYSSRVVQ